MKKLLEYSLVKRGINFYKKHTYISIGLGCVAIGLLWWGYSHATSSTTPTYVLGTVRRGTVAATVGASGQVSASNQLDVKAKGSGEVVSVNVIPGQKVVAGQLLAVIDPSDAQKAVRDAQINLESAQLSFEKTNRPTEALTLIQAENALAQATSNLDKAYDDGFNAVADAFLDLPTVMTGLEDILYGHSVNSAGSQDNISAYNDMVFSYAENVTVFKNDAAAKYKKARESYDAAFLAYRGLTRTSERTSVESLIDQTYLATKVVADAVKSTNDFLGFVEDSLVKKDRSIPQILTTHKNSIKTYTSTTNSHLGDVLNSKESLSTARYSILEKTQSLADLKAGADVIDLKSAQITLTQRQNALIDAKNNLADYYVRAPFAGSIASIATKKFETLGSGGTVASLITTQRVAELSLNEVDAAKIKVGDKASITFDAIDNFSVDGSVAEIDPVGTVSQGVVSYTLKIGFNVQDERIKPGMTVNATIITATKENVLIVPVSAIKIVRGQSFVEVFDKAVAPEPTSNTASSTNRTQGFQKIQTITSSVTPTQIPVVTGLSDDAFIEIESGLTEGQQIIVRTAASATTATAKAAPSLFGGAGGGNRAFTTGAAPAGGTVRAQTITR